MSNADTRRPQPVSVEDWDDEAEASIPGTRTTANVAVKRDQSAESDQTYSACASPLPRYKYADSGYASKTPTVSSMTSSQRRHISDLKLDTSVVTERERKPYAMSAAVRDGNTQQSARPREKAQKQEPEPAKRPFCHSTRGLCWVCDKYAFHFDPKNPPKDLLKISEALKSAAFTQQPPQQPPKVSVPRPNVEEGPRPSSRRMSSNQPRPTSMYAGTPVQAPFPQYPAMHHGWNMAPTPPPGVVYTSHPYVVPSTPVGYAPPQQFFYEPQPDHDDYGYQQPAKPTRRLSMAMQDKPPLLKKPSRTNTMQEKSTVRDQRPTMVSQASHQSKKSIDDKMAMPPPPKPQHATTIGTSRPRPGRSNTYHANASTKRYSQHLESESEDDDYFLDARALVSLRDQQPTSPRRPPSSYKPPVAAEASERPQLMPKSKSYHDGPNQMQVASTMPRRRTTDSMPTLTPTSEEQEINAEAYMRKRGSMPVVDLTADSLRALSNAIPKHVSDQRSESGSTTSHPLSHHSSSKDSSTGVRRITSATGSALGQAKGTSMNISVNGLSFSITDDGQRGAERPPVSVDVGGIQISMNKDKENVDYRRPGQKALERSGSMSSRPSRRSLTQSSLISAATNAQREERLGMERRESYVDEDEREMIRQMKRLSTQSSRQASRNASSVRQASGEQEMGGRPKITSKRSSIDYSVRRDEPVM